MAQLKGYSGKAADGKAIKPAFEFNLVKRNADGQPIGKANYKAFAGEQLQRDFNDNGELRQ